MTQVIALSRSQGYANAVSRLEAWTKKDFSLVSRKEELTLESLRKLSAEKIFFPHWSYKIPKEIFENYECVIFHMTDLPFGRGGTPLQNLIVRGFTETKISALRCVEEIDAGPVYLKKPLLLNGTAEEIYARAADIIFEMIVEIIEKKPVPEPQSGPVEVFSRRTPGQSNLVDVKNLQQAYDHIRMLDAEGYPKAFLETETLRIEFDQASFSKDSVTARVVIKGKESEK